MKRGLTAVLALALAGCKVIPEEERTQKILHFAVRSKLGTLDPVQGGMQYVSMSIAPVYQSLLRYTYLKYPYSLEPELLAQMPEVSPDGLTYTFALREARFHADACLGGRGRPVEAKDVVYSMKRMANRELSPRGWWVYADRIVGFDELKKAADTRPPGTPFDVDRPVEGLEVVDASHLRIRLLRPYPQLLYVLAMPFTSVVPRECVEHYGPAFAQHPVGTGPFRLKSWIPEVELRYEKNPDYFDDRYPDAERTGLPADAPLLAKAGQKVPFLDGIVIHVYEQDQPMWLKWRVRDIDVIQVPAEYLPIIAEPDLRLRDTFAKAGIGSYNLALLDFVYRGFNFEDPIVGGNERGKLVRQAIALAMDADEVNDVFYNRANVIYDGPIPPGLDGHAEGKVSPYRGPNIEAAKRKLAEAGYPGGAGLPPIQYHTSLAGNGAEQAELLTRQLKRVGIQVDAQLHSFPELNDRIKRRKAQMFGLAWGSDYPDAENNLALFYGPNSSPGANAFNYQNPEYDRRLELARVMLPSPERTAHYVALRDMVIEDAIAVGGMARTRNYVWNARVAPFVPAEVWYRWLLYLDVAPRGD